MADIVPLITSFTACKFSDEIPSNGPILSKVSSFIPDNVASMIVTIPSYCSCVISPASNIILALVSSNPFRASSTTMRTPSSFSSDTPMIGIILSIVVWFNPTTEASTVPTIPSNASVVTPNDSAISRLVFASNSSLNNVTVSRNESNCFCDICSRRLNSSTMCS